MKLALACAAALLAGACAQTPAAAPVVEPAAAAPESPDPAPAPIPVVEALPLRGDGPPLPSDRKALTRILVGSCSEETQPIPILAAVARLKPELFLFIGDNVYGDATAGDMSLPELKQAYADLSINAYFSAFNMSTPLLATWDDHDYAAGDGGSDFPGKARSEQLFEAFWRDASLGGDHPGVYGARVFGPPGRRVQVILLDTRFFRSSLKRAEPPSPGGYAPYLPDSDPAKTMLGEAQWAWLQGELRRPAEIRLLVSSVQVLADDHPFEGWKALPAEQARLYRTIRESGAKGVVLISGDRHVGALYRETGAAPYPLHELTTSSLNLPVATARPEQSSAQKGPVYRGVNFGMIEIDWPGRRLFLTVRDVDGAPQRTSTVTFKELHFAS